MTDARPATVDAEVKSCNLNYMSTDEGGKAASGEPETSTKPETGTEPETQPGEKLRGWFAGRLPGDWFTAEPDIVVDREEITVVGTLADPETRAEATDAERSEAADGRIRRFREQTRDGRIKIAREAEHRFGRKVSWGVRCGGQAVMFTTMSVPVMTRLRQSQRLVLDTLVEAGVARSRSEALAWCVRLVGEHEDSWLADLREALRRVEQVRSEGPASREG
jgi:hypothetical protein